MKFDPDSDYSKHRDSAGGNWLIQNGGRFSVRGKYLGKVDGKDVKDVTDKDKKRRQEIRQRAAEKLKDFSGNDETPGTVAEALKENRAAAAAEEQVVE